MELKGDQLQQAKELNALTKGLFNEEISKDDYLREAERITNKIEVLA